jgi:hypothetical protein
MKNRWRTMENLWREKQAANEGAAYCRSSNPREKDRSKTGCGDG